METSSETTTEALPELSATDLDILMGKDPTSLSKQDLAQIVKYHRKQRAMRASGEKPEKASGPAPKIDLKSLLSKVVAKNAEPPITRRV